MPLSHEANLSGWRVFQSLPKKRSDISGTLLGDSGGDMAMLCPPDDLETSNPLVETSAALASSISGDIDIRCCVHNLGDV